MLRAFVIIGVILDVLGTVWILQGVNILPGSFMTGDPSWARTGVAVDAIGLALIVIGLRRMARAKAKN